MYMWRETHIRYINVLFIAGQLDCQSSVSSMNGRIFLFQHPQYPVQWVLRAQGLIGFCFKFFVLGIQAVINLQFNTLVFFTFPEKQSNFESPPTRKDEKAD